MKLGDLLGALESCYNTFARHEQMRERMGLPPGSHKLLAIGKNGEAYSIDPQAFLEALDEFLDKVDKATEVVETTEVEEETK